ncbi:hypothetical protein ACHAO7_004641 [Fusarium culmorum]
MGDFIDSKLDLSTIKPSFSTSSEPESPRSKSLIEALSLELHIEGGYFRQTDADPTTIPSTYSSKPLSDQTLALTGGTREGYSTNTRRLSTTIFYLLTPRQSKGNFHRNRSRVIHTLHRGRGRYVLLHPDGRIESFVVGNAVERETVVPGFEYEDHAFLTHQGIKELLKEEQVRELEWLVRKSE